jgi:signal transduction histidine kinase
MTGRGRLMLAVLASWLALVCLLGAWWWRLALRQAARIAELETQAGTAAAAVQEHLDRTQRMLFWESGTYFLLLLATSGVLCWLYWREARRARSIQAFFASMTHELRTPLTSIRLQAESIADSLSTAPAQRRLIARLLEDTTRLEGQVETTLELARVEGGGQVMLQSVALKPWIEKTVRDWQETYGEKVRFATSLAEVTAQLDQGALRIIFRNLLENSLRYAGSDPVEIEISLAADGHLTYRDNGAGFSGPRLGELFRKGPGSQGAGVGLYLIRVLAEQMGGSARFAGGAGFPVELRLQHG